MGKSDICKERKKILKILKSKKKKKLNESSSSCGSSSESLSSTDKETKKILKKALKKLKKEKRRKREKKRKNLKKVLKSSLKEKTVNSEEKTEGSSASFLMKSTLEKSKHLAPMTKDEWEKQQNTLKRIYDKETGRMRLIRGSGEIVEECISKKRHMAINKQATKGDGLYFQKQLLQQIK